VLGDVGSEVEGLLWGELQGCFGYYAGVGVVVVGLLLDSNPSVGFRRTSLPASTLEVASMIVDSRSRMRVKRGV